MTKKRMEENLYNLMHEIKTRKVDGEKEVSYMSVKVGMFLTLADIYRSSYSTLKQDIIDLYNLLMRYYIKIRNQVCRKEMKGASNDK